MSFLTSKIQLNNFEVGEFNEEKKRNYEETIELIENFPWNKQRENIVINLTNPSITIEGFNNDFLKLAVFFNGKFVLYYLDNGYTLFTKSFIDIKDSYKYLKNYFTKNFSTSDFKKENTWLQGNLKHFVSQDFKYIVTNEKIRKFIWSTSAINFAYSLFVIIFFLVKGEININNLGILFICLSMFIIGGGLNLILLFNYYAYSKDKVLIMSKGNDEFYFGNIIHPAKFNKKDILQFTLKRHRNYKSPISSFAIVSIELKDGTNIKIPNLLVNYYSMEQKLRECAKIEKGGFPLL